MHQRACSPVLTIRRRYPVLSGLLCSVRVSRIPLRKERICSATLQRRHMLRSGASLDVIATVLRHRSSDTTAYYAKVDIETAAADCATLAGGSTMLTEHVNRYVELHRAMGFKFKTPSLLAASLRPVCRVARRLCCAQ